MQFTHLDLALLVTMTLAVVSMGLVFPHLGLADTSPNASDMPEFNTTAAGFDVVGDFPDRQNTPATGTLHFDNTQSALTDTRQLWFNGDTSSGTETVLFDNGSNSEAKIVINYWDSGSAPQDELILSNPGDAGQIDNSTQGWTVTYEFIERTNDGLSNVTMTVYYEIEQRPSDQQWYTSIPIIGSVFGTADQLAGIVGWIGSILWWIFGTLFEILSTLVIMLYEVMSFVVNLMVYILSTFNAVISSAESWAAVFVTVPLIIVFYEFVKLIMIGISLLPTT